MLTVEGSVLRLQQAGVNLKAQALADNVALIRALGGGFAPQELPEQPVAAQAR